MSTPNPSTSDGSLNRAIKRFERGVVVSLVVLMMAVVALASLELVWIVVKDIVTPPILLLEVDELLEIFAFFLPILIGVERTTDIALSSELTQDLLP